MTWKEFKDVVKAEGVSDEMKIDYIDVTYPQNAEDIDIVVQENNVRILDA